MVIDKTPLPDDPTPSEAPPSYETVTSTTRAVGPSDRKAPIAGGSPTRASPSGSSTSLPFSSASSAKSPGFTSPPASAKGKGKASWFNFSGYKTSKDVKSTTLGLIRDLVRTDFHSPATVAILQSCAEACSSHNLSLASILQEKSIEQHTPLYWAIVKRKPDETQDESAQVPDLLTALLSYSTPLSQETISDIRYACLITSDQPLFQRLRLSPDFTPTSALDEILIGTTLPPDEVEVINLPDDEGSFAVDFKIVAFQKRMMIAKNIVVEFIARSRMWRLRFFVATDNSDVWSGIRQGSWGVSLSLMEHSPPTWVDSQLLIADPVVIEPDLMIASNRAKPKPTISMRLKTTQPLTPQLRGHSTSTGIAVAFEDSLMATSLQHSGSSYIAPDEKLRARLEARLAKPDNECIIC